MWKLDIHCGRWRHYDVTFLNVYKLRTSRQNTALSHSIIQQLIINNSQLFNKRQREYYLVSDKLKCHNLCSKYPPFSLTQVWIRMSHPRHSVAVTLSRVNGDRTWCGLWIKSCFMLNCLKFHHILHYTTASMHQQVPCTRKKMISWAHGLLRAVNSLQL